MIITREREGRHQDLREKNDYGEFVAAAKHHHRRQLLHHLQQK